MPAVQALHRSVFEDGVRATADNPHTTRVYFLPPLGLGARCDNAEAAAVLAAFEYLPSRITREAALAALAPVRRELAIPVHLLSSGDVSSHS